MPLLLSNDDVADLLTVEEKRGRRLICSGGEVVVLDTREAECLCAPETCTEGEREQ